MPEKVQTLFLNVKIICEKISDLSALLNRMYRK